MASPPLSTRLRAFHPDARMAIGVVAGLVGIGMLTAWILPATGAQNPIPLVVSSATPWAMPGDSPEAASAPLKAKPASRTRKARNIPAFPRDHRHHGKRIVYDKALMTVWLIDKNDAVVARFPVVGRFDRPAKGTYRIFSKSPKANNPNSKVTFNHMARFTYGPDTRSAIGFHAIPRYYDGTPMHSTRQLGLAIARGGCVRLSEKAAEQVYDFLKVGDLVVVLPSP